MTLGIIGLVICSANMIYDHLIFVMGISSRKCCNLRDSAAQHARNAGQIPRKFGCLAGETWRASLSDVAPVGWEVEGQP